MITAKKDPWLSSMARTLITAASQTEREMSPKTVNRLLAGVDHEVSRYSLFSFSIAFFVARFGWCFADEIITRQKESWLPGTLWTCTSWLRQLARTLNRYCDMRSRTQAGATLREERLRQLRTACEKLRTLVEPDIQNDSTLNGLPDQVTAPVRTIAHCMEDIGESIEHFLTDKDTTKRNSQ